MILVSVRTEKICHFYGYIWYFNINLKAEYPSVYFENGPVYSCSIGPCKNCSYAFKDPDYGNICLSEVTDDTKNSYSETCTSSSGCSQTLNFQCSCSTSTCVYSPSANTCGCVDSSNKLTSTNCQCKSPYNLISGKCCNPLCSSCATSNECTGCKDTNAEAVSGTCKCKVGYYGTPSSTSTTGCVICSTGCSTCITSICDTCSDPNAEVLSGSCVCKSGYSGTASLSSTTGCISCSAGCSTCVLTSCDTCSDPNAEVISGSCVCKNGYYGTPSLTSTTGCVLCSQGCSTCVLSICDTCSDPNAEVISSSCVCKSGYYGTPSGIGTDQCYSCGHGCADCTSNTTCNTCFDSNAEGSTGNCICNSGFYGIASLNNVSSCFACKNKCSVCVDSSTCSVCSDTNAEVESNECVCKTGYYEKISNSSVSTCQNCNAGCQSCTETQCFSCFDPQAQPNGSSCECKAGFYGTPSNDSNSLCIQCGSGCYECTAPNLCLSCFEDNAEVINGECVCKSGFYGTPSESNGCISCIIGCSKCQDTVSCNETFDPNAEVFNNEVRCKDGYFGLIGNNNQSCLECVPECNLCESENICFECRLNNSQLIEGRCECLDGFYFSLNESDCTSCPEECLTCSNNGDCIECKTENSVFDKEIGCKCMIGYYNSSTISETKCVKCMDECKKCDSGSTCKECKNDFTVLNEAERCICKEGYYNSSASSTTIKCKACDSSCKACNNEGFCINCSKNNTEVKENGKCECMNNFYSKINSYLNCENCPGYRIEGKCESFCKSGYGWANGTCYKCGELCNECDEALRCLNCTNGANLTDGKCSCLKGFIKEKEFCEAKFFYSNLKFVEKNKIMLGFTQAPEIDVSKMDLKVEFNRKERKFKVGKQNFDNFAILDLGLRHNESGNIVIEILNRPLFSVNESQLYNYKLDLYLDTEYNEFSYISFSIQVIMLILFIASLMTAPSTFWSLLNTIQMIMFMPLNSVPYSKRILNFILAIKDIILIPNFLPRIFDPDSTSTPSIYCIRDDITTSNAERVDSGYFNKTSAIVLIVQKVNEDFIIVPQIHKRTLIWLHGFSCAGDFHLEQFLAIPILPDCKVIMPTADLREIPSMNNELFRAWYTRLGFRYHDSIEASVSRIVKLMESENELTKELYIGGFSQGGVLALMCGLSRSSVKVKAIFSYSGYPFPMNIQTEYKDIPVLVYHGLKDLIVPWDKAFLSYQNNLAGVKYDLQIEPECAHEIPNEGFVFAKKWLGLKGLGGC